MGCSYPSDDIEPKEILCSNCGRPLEGCQCEHTTAHKGGNKMEKTISLSMPCQN